MTSFSASASNSAASPTSDGYYYFTRGRHVSQQAMLFCFCAFLLFLVLCTLLILLLVYWFMPTLWLPAWKTQFSKDILHWKFLKKIHHISFYIKKIGFKEWSGTFSLQTHSHIYLTHPHLFLRQPFLIQSWVKLCQACLQLQLNYCHFELLPLWKKRCRVLH